MPWFDLIFYLLPLVLLVAAYFTGSWIEARHYRSIREREATLVGLPVVTFDDADGQFPLADNFSRAALVSGSVVISIDRFKQFLAGLRNLFGGRVSAYESLLDRARREAILRMKTSAPGAAAIANLRVETATIGGGGEGGLGTIEVHAYGTALFADETSPTTA